MAGDEPVGGQIGAQLPAPRSHRHSRLVEQVTRAVGAMGTLVVLRQPPGGQLGERKRAKQRAGAPREPLVHPDDGPVVLLHLLLAGGKAGYEGFREVPLDRHCPADSILRHCPDAPGRTAHARSPLAGMLSSSASTTAASAGLVGRGRALCGGREKAAARVPLRGCSRLVASVRSRPRRRRALVLTTRSSVLAEGRRSGRLRCEQTRMGASRAERIDQCARTAANRATKASR